MLLVICIRLSFWQTYVKLIKCIKNKFYLKKLNIKYQTFCYSLISKSMSSSNKTFVKYHSLPITTSHSSYHATHMSRLSSLTRAEKSLTALTTKFMTLLQESHNGVLDLRSVSHSQNVFFISIKSNMRRFCFKACGQHTESPEKTSLRHNKCFGGHRSHREIFQK